MEENTPTKLTLEMNGVTMSWEGPWDADIYEIMEGFVGCLRGVTFGEWVISRIKEWCEENEVETKESEVKDYNIPEPDGDDDDRVCIVKQPKDTIGYVTSRA